MRMRNVECGLRNLSSELRAASVRRGSEHVMQFRIPHSEIRIWKED